MSGQKTERLHSLDSLRAIMMMLGIVLHAAITYIGGEPSFGWPMRDPSADSEFLLWLLVIIHNFRMPIFMVVAGFFAALLFYERSPKKMLINRVNRLVFPFVVFVLLLWPLVTMAFSYSNDIFGFSEEIESVIGSGYMNLTIYSFSELKNLIRGSTMHLWFIYYLIMFSLVSFGIGMLFKKMPTIESKIKKTFETIIQAPIKKLILFTFLNFVILLIMNDSWVSTSTSFTPDSGTFLFYIYFYFFGWILFKSKHYLSSFMDYDWLYSILAVLVFTTYHFADTSLFSTELSALIKSLSVWLFVFGFTGLFLRFFSHHSARMRYVSDSAYWVYLLHLPLVAFVPGLISDWNIPDVLKFSIVVAATGIVCFVTYHYFVRTSFIGRFLNGKKYSRKLSDIKHAPITKQSQSPILEQQ